MDRSGSEATLDEAIARELARHSPDSKAERSLDDALADLARDCWSRAEAMTDPIDVATAARVAIEAAVACAPRTKVHVTKRQCWAVWFMAQRLFDISVYDSAHRCVGECEKPTDAPPSWHCPAADDPTHAACALSLMFPYRHVSHDGSGHLTRVENQAKAAAAIVRGFARIGIYQTISAVRQILKRFPDRH
ncbi:MAG: hypothetical protein IMZ67_01945 [Acidobacteria bacterium]|nr:hypothetical protein [Acidobacteriota bacterium]